MGRRALVLTYGSWGPAAEEDGRLSPPVHAAPRPGRATAGLGCSGRRHADRQRGWLGALQTWEAGLTQRACYFVASTRPVLNPAI